MHATEDVTEPGATPGSRDRVKIALRNERLHEVRAGLDVWREGPWECWAKDERPVRQSIQLYNMVHGGVAETPLGLVWGHRARPPATAGWHDRHASIEQPVDLEVQAQGALTIRPRNVPPSVTMKPFLHLNVEGSSETQRKVHEFFATVTTGPDAGLSPFEHSGWENLLDLAAGRLKGRHITREQVGNGESVKSPGKDLAVYSTWAIYGRPRSDNLRAQDLQRLRRKVDKATDDDALPKSLRGFVAPAPGDAAGTKSAPAMTLW